MQTLGRSGSGILRSIDDMAGTPVSAFAHLNAEKSALYRALLGVFVSERARFTIALRPPEIAAGLAARHTTDPDSPHSSETEITAALEQLVAWNNLLATRDTGLTIATRVMAEGRARPWRFGVADYLAAPKGVAFAGEPGPTPWDPALSDAMQVDRRSVHEEAVFSKLAEDLAPSDDEPSTCDWSRR